MNLIPKTSGCTFKYIFLHVYLWSRFTDRDKGVCPIVGDWTDWNTNQDKNRDPETPTTQPF